MPSTITDRLNGLTTSVAVKPPCVAVSLLNLTLAGLQTVGGVVLVAGDRVLLTAQTDTTQNGIYTADSGDWTRAADFDGARDAVQGTLVLVRNQFIEGAFYELTSADPITFGTSAITFRLRDAPYGFEPYDVRRYGAQGDNSNNDAPAAAIVGALPSHYTHFTNGLTFRFVPNSVSPYTFGNSPTVNVYTGVLLTVSDHMIEEPGSRLHIVSRAGGAATGDLQYCYATNKNMVLGTQTNLVVNGISVDTNNDGDASNSNHRGYYFTGVDAIRLLHTRGFSSGSRRGNHGNFQNSRNVQILGHFHHKNTQGFNLRYTDNVCIVGGVWYDFSEALDFDGKQERAVVVGNTFHSTSRVGNQILDFNGQVDGVFSGWTAFTCGEIAHVNQKFTTADNFTDYVNGVTTAVKIPSQRIIIAHGAGKAIGNTTQPSFNISNDWGDGGHAGYEGTHDLLITGVMLEDTSWMMVWECERLTLRDVYLGSVIQTSTSTTIYAVDLTSLINTGDQRSWSAMTGLIDGLTINGAGGGGLRVHNSKFMNIRNISIHDINRDGTSEFAMRLGNLPQRGSQITVDGANITSGNVNINGALSDIPAWAATTLYRRTQMVSNGGRYYRAISDTGTSAGAGGPTGITTAIVDGTVSWEYVSEPFSVLWGDTNRLASGSSLVFTGDAFKYTHGRPVLIQLGDFAATGTVTRALYTATRKCYVVRALIVASADVAVDATNFRTFLFRSLTNLGATTTTISSVNLTAAITAFVQIDGGFTVNEAGAYLEPGDTIYLSSTHTLTGKALTGVLIQLEVLDC